MSSWELELEKKEPQIQRLRKKNFGLLQNQPKSKNLFHNNSSRRELYTKTFGGTKDAKGPNFLTLQPAWPFIISTWFFEISSLKNQVRRTRFFVYFDLDFYCLCSLQKSSLK